MNVINDEFKTTGHEFKIETDKYYFDYKKTVGYDYDNNVNDTDLYICWANKELKKSIFSIQLSQLYILKNKISEESLTVYNYNKQTKNIQKLDVNKFAEIYLDNNINYAQYIWEGFLYKVARIKGGDYYSNKKIVFERLTNEIANEYIILGYNIDQNTAETLFQTFENTSVKLNILTEFSDNNDIININKYEIKPDYEYFYDLDVNYEFQYTTLELKDKSKNEELINKLLDYAKNNNTKINKNVLKSNLNLYDQAFKEITEYNENIANLVNNLEQFTDKYNKAPKKLTEEQKTQYILLENNIRKYNYRGANTVGSDLENGKISEYSICHLYIKFLNEIQNLIKIYEKGNIPYKNRININEILNFGTETKSGMDTLFIHSSYDIKQLNIKNPEELTNLRDDEKDKVKEFINKYYGEHIYLTYKDNNGYIYTSATPKRLFWSTNNYRLCYFKNNSRQSGYPIDNSNQLYRLDVKIIAKDEKINKQNHNIYRFINFLKQDWL